MPHERNERPAIRTAQENDCSAIAQLVNSHGSRWDTPYIKKYLRDYFKHPEMFAKDEVFVLEGDKGIIGTVGYCSDKYESRNYWLGWFYVDKKHCGNGHARELLAFVKKQLRSRKARRLFVDTSSYEFYGNALHFYISCGFKFEAAIKNYYGRGEDQLVLSSDLGDR